MQAVAEKEKPVEGVFETQEQALVKKKLKQIKSAKLKWEKDFKRMRENMEFLAGLQYSQQQTITEERYVINLTLRLINQKVATLYAKNPTVEASRRPRLDFKVWDESVQSLNEAMMMAQLAISSGQPIPMEIGALLADVQAGRAKQKLISNVGRTLQYAVQYFFDAHKPDFKEQMKQLVRRVGACGVGYVKPILCTTGYDQPSSVDHGSDIDDRLGRVKSLVEHLRESGESEDSAHFATLRSLMQSIGASTALGEAEAQLPERLEFDFPPATSIIPDEGCRSLKGFIAARWVAQEYLLPVSEVNAIFGTEVKTGSEEAKEYNQAGLEASIDTEKDEDPLVCLYELFDYNTRTVAFLVDGWKDWVKPPEVELYGVSGFWRIFALTFNDIEVESGLKISPFPPSDVEIVRHPQKEWNRTRDALRAQRCANAPKYVTREGFMTEDDKAAWRNAEPNQILSIQGAPMDQPVEKLVVPVVHAPIDPDLYSAAPLEQDIMFGTGTQQANLGPAQPNVTATVATVAEQSRMDVSSSNVDDLDGLLSQLSQACNEMLLKGATKETITRIVGEGAVFPDSPQTRSDFLNEIFLTIQAASSGRPNKAMDIANFRDLAPLLAQSGANPIALVEEGVRRLDDNLDIDRFFPLSAPQAAEASSGSEQQSANSASESSETSPQNSLNDQNPESNSSMQSPPGAALAV